MATFYYAMEGPNWNPLIQERWMDDTKDECLWFSSGIGYFDMDGDYHEWSPIEFGFPRKEPCDNLGKLTWLDLQGLELANLTPYIPPEIALLTSLSAIALYENGIEGTIEQVLPAEFFELGSLTDVFLYGNAISLSLIHI